MKPEIKVGQVREAARGVGESAKTPPERVAIREEDADRWRIVRKDGRTSWLMGATILRRYPFVVTDAPPEAKAPIENSKGREFYASLSTPPSAPSPLELVREALLRLKLEAMNTARPGLQEQAITALSALATLEESIRRDEREACAKVADEHTAAGAESVISRAIRRRR